jgi:CheY-like chemotaxis protein
VVFDVLVGVDPGGPAAARRDVSRSNGREGARRLLLVEDDDINRITTRMYLERLGYAVDVAVNGREALEKCAGEAYDCVLMDIRMPEMDGIEAAKRIRDGLGGETPGNVPIVAVTAHALKGDREKFLAADMDEYVPKPVDLEELRSVLVSVFDAPRDNG